MGRAAEFSEGLPLAESWDDIRVMGALLEATRYHELWELGDAFLDRPAGCYGSLAQCLQQPSAADCIRDAETILALYSDIGLSERIRQEGLDVVYRLELAVADPTIAMIQNGLGVDVARLESRTESHIRSAIACLGRIERAVKRRFNPLAADQLTEVLYGKLGLPVIATTRTGRPATDKATLIQLRQLDESGLVALILQYQSATTLARTADSLLRSVNPRTGRIHPNLDPLAAATGRYGCSEPPLQSVPKPILAAFVAEDGYILVEADFSQIELRVLAHLPRDRSLQQAFCNPGADIDLHRRTAAVALGIPEAAVTEDERNDIGKGINYGLVNGQTEFGLSDTMGISVYEASQFIERYFDGHPGVRRWIDATGLDAQIDGEVRTFYGRRRSFASGDWSEKSQARTLRQAVNHVVQGTAADINKMSLARLHSALPEDCRMLLTVHDSVLLEVPRDQLSQVVGVAREVMEEPPPDFSIPLKVDIRAGRTWRDCKRKPAIEAER